MLKSFVCVLCLSAVLFSFSPAFAIELVPYQVGSKTANTINIHHGRSKPDREIPRMTLVTDQGRYPITLQKIPKKCQKTVCSSVCRYHAVYHLDKEIEGRPLFALEGTKKISNAMPMRFSAPRPISDLSSWAPREPVQVIYPQRRWIKFDKLGSGEYTLLTSVVPTDWFPLLNLSSCKIRSYQKFTNIHCSEKEEVVLLYEGKHLVLISIGEYSTARADLLSAFTMDNQRYYALRLGLKAEEPVAVLTQEAGKWKVFIRRAYTATYC